MKILLTGAGGFLGSYVLRVATSTPTNTVTSLRVGAPHLPLSSSCAEITAPEDISANTLHQRLQGNEPSHIIHMGALSAPEACERDPEAALKANAELTKILTDYASSVEAHITFISTDLVFDGGQAPPGGLREGDRPRPNSEYARSKVAGESAVLQYKKGCVVRLSLIYGHAPSSAKGVLGWMEKAFKNQDPLTLFHDEYRTPVHVGDATKAILGTAAEALNGIWHFGGPERVSRVEFGRKIAEALHYNPEVIRSVARADVALIPARPEDVSLNSSRLIERLSLAPKDVRSALATYTEWR